MTTQDDAKGELFHAQKKASDMILKEISDIRFAVESQRCGRTSFSTMLVASGGLQRRQAQPMMARLPRWSNKQGALDLITREFTGAKIMAVISYAIGDDDLRWQSVEQKLLDLAARLKGSEVISPSQDRVHMGILLEAFVEASQPQFDDSGSKKPGRRKKSVELRRAERRQRSIMPEAERLCASVVDFLKPLYPKSEMPPRRMEHIRDLAIEWTVAWFNKHGFDEVTEDYLRQYMGYPRMTREGCRQGRDLASPKPPIFRSVTRLPASRKTRSSSDPPDTIFEPRAEARASQREEWKE
jgi:hypothetical protein